MIQHRLEYCKKIINDDEKRICDHLLPFLLGLLKSSTTTYSIHLYPSVLFLWPLRQESLVNQDYEDYMYINYIKLIKDAIKNVSFSES
jgi:hypothetical protein